MDTETVQYVTARKRITLQMTVGLNVILTLVDS